MKKSAFIFATAIVAAMMCVFTGCSDDGDGEEYIQFPEAPSEEVITRLATTTTSIVFASTGKSRKIERAKGDKWIDYRMDSSLAMLADLMPFMGIGPAEIIFKDGKTFCRLNTLYDNPWSKEDRSTSETFIVQVWATYTAETYAQRIYVVSDFDYNKKNQTIRFDCREFGVVSCDNSELILSGLGKDFRTWEYYEQTTVAEGEDHFFENCDDAYRFILACARKKYGNEMVVKYFTPNGEVYSEREINLDYLEKDWNDGW